MRQTQLLLAISLYSACALGKSWPRESFGLCGNPRHAWVALDEMAQGEDIDLDQELGLSDV